MFVSDPFAADNEGLRSSGQDTYIHIRIQQRNGRKTLTTVQGISADFDLRKIVRVVKKVCANWEANHVLCLWTQCAVGSLISDHSLCVSFLIFFVGVCLQWYNSGASRVRGSHPATGWPTYSYQWLPQKDWTGTWRNHQGIGACAFIKVQSCHAFCNALSLIDIIVAAFLGLQVHGF